MLKPPRSDPAGTRTPVTGRRRPTLSACPKSAMRRICPYHERAAPSEAHLVEPRQPQPHMKQMLLTSLGESLVLPDRGRSEFKYSGSEIQALNLSGAKTSYRSESVIMNSNKFHFNKTVATSVSALFPFDCSSTRLFLEAQFCYLGLIFCLIFLLVTFRIEIIPVKEDVSADSCPQFLDP